MKYMHVDPAFNPQTVKISFGSVETSSALGVETSLDSSIETAEKVTKKMSNDLVEYPIFYERSRWKFSRCF